jgi:signal transduction histidine kinase
MQQIAASADAMSEMIGKLTDFASSAQGGSIPLTPQRVEHNALCPAAAAELSAGAPGCRVDFHPAGELHGEWDPDRLRQVLSNLLTNAVQHGDPSCVVTLTTGEAPAGSGGGRGARKARRAGGEGGEGGADVFVTVHNTGAPVPPDALPTLFDPFVRVSSDMLARRRPGSMGLGLYIAKAVAEAHGGTIAVTSTADAGTTFTVRLPRRCPRRPAM